MTSVGKTRVALLAAALVLLALFLLAGLWPGGDREPSPPAEAPAGPRSQLEPTAPTTPAAPRPARAEAGEAPIIDEITVEKQEVCAGEENLVTVRAHTPGGRGDAWLHTVVAGLHGSRVPLRAVPWGELRPRIMVFGKGGVVTSAPVPDFVVKDCGPRRGLSIQVGQVTNTLDTYELTAHLKQAGEPFAPSAYRWRFGDGGTAETRVPWVTHAYDAGSEDRLFMEYLVECEAVSASGEKVTGRSAVQVMNHEFANLDAKQVLALSIELTPRFPEMGAGGVVSQQVRVHHHRKRAIEIEEVVRKVEGAPGALEERLDPAAVLGASRIPPEGLQATVRWDTSRAPPGATMVTYRLLGTDGEGHRAYGRFSIMKPMPAPTRETGVPVNDPVLQARILKARELLGKKMVTYQDLVHLEAEGAFANLTVDRALVPAPMADPKLGARGSGR